MINEAWSCNVSTWETEAKWLPWAGGQSYGVIGSGVSSESLSQTNRSENDTLYFLTTLPHSQVVSDLYKLLCVGKHPGPFYLLLRVVTQKLPSPTGTTVPSNVWWLHLTAKLTHSKATWKESLSEGSFGRVGLWACLGAYPDCATWWCWWRLFVYLQPLRLETTTQKLYYL